MKTNHHLGHFKPASQLKIFMKLNHFTMFAALATAALTLSSALAAPTPAQQAYLKASNTGARDEFGFSIAVSGDTAVIGAHNECLSWNSSKPH